MTEIQKVLIKILKGFDEVCQRHNIEYFLTGGSSLGAMRHHEIIPWDDDVDLGITRKNWNKLRPFLEEELPEDLILVDRVSYPSLKNPIARIMDTNSTVLYRASLADGCPKGLYIEVFIHDPVPFDKVQEHKRDFLIYCELLTPYFSVFNDKLVYRKGLSDEELQIMEEYYREKKRADKVGLDTILDEYEERIGQYTMEESDFILLNWGVNSCYYPIENFRGIKYMPFGDMMVPLPTGACDNLRIDYGNSWTDYPPEPEQVAHIIVEDADLYGDEYMKLINAQINPERTRQMRLSNKSLLMKAIPEKIGKKKKLFAIQMRQAKILDERFEDVERLYEEGKFDEIASKYCEYIVLKKNVKNYTFEQDICDERKEIVAKALVMLGRTTDAENVMNIHRSMRIKDVDNTTMKNILRITKANSCFYDNLLDESKALLDSVEGDLRNALLFRKVTARISILEGIVTEDIFRMAEEYPDDYEVQKIMADALTMQGKMEESKKLYDQVLNYSNNGMDILDIKLKRAKENE